MRPTCDGTGGDLAHIWLLPAEEQVDEQPADMVAAPGALGYLCTPVRQRPQADADARAAGQRGDPAHDRNRAVDAAVLLPARGEIEDLQ